MKFPIDILLDAIQWEPIHEIQDDDPEKSDLPRATHRGILKIGELELDVYQLDNGQRLISKESLDRWMAS